MQRRHLLALPIAALGWRHAIAATTVLTRVETTLGSFFIAVDPGVAPRTVANYLAYVDGGFLDGGSVYRLVALANQAPETQHKIEVVQWGMKLDDSKSPPFPPIVHETTRETGLRHQDGVISRAAVPGETDSGGARQSDLAATRPDEATLRICPARTPARVCRATARASWF